MIDNYEDQKRRFELRLTIVLFLIGILVIAYYLGFIGS